MSEIDAAQHWMRNRTWDELSPGDRARFTRVIGEHEVDALAGLISALLVSEFPGPGTFQLSQSLRFERELVRGESLHVHLEVREKFPPTREVALRCVVVDGADATVALGEVRVAAPTVPVSRPRGPADTLLSPVPVLDAVAQLRCWVESVRGATALPCAVVHPCDAPSLRGALEARDAGLIIPVIVAPRHRVLGIAASAGLSLEGVELLDTPHSHASAAQSAALAANRRVAMLMKGSLHTDELMEAVLAEPALRTGRRMSHAFRLHVPASPRPLLLTDAAINIAPDLQAKADIVRNAIDLAHALGLERPRVALLSAVETVTPRMPSTLDAAALCKMADRGQISGAMLDGPLAFDNAISQEAALIKGIDSAVAGRADILVAPDIEAANMLAKQLEYLAGASSCGVVLGAQVPIALTSRADPPLSRVASAALAAVFKRGLLSHPTGSHKGN